MEDLDKIISEGIVFKGKALSKPAKDGKVKTKAKKKVYITGAHGSGSAKMKEGYRTRRANRNKK